MTLPALGITDPPIIICIPTAIAQERELTGLDLGECNIITTLVDTNMGIDCYVIKTFFNNCLLYMPNVYNNHEISDKLRQAVQEFNNKKGRD
jgi:hypothetical protein